MFEALGGSFGVYVRDIFVRRYLDNSFGVSPELIISFRYGGSAGNTAEENSSDFCLI